MLRLLASQKTKWDAEGRDRTIDLFLHELSFTLAEEAIEYMAEHHSKCLGEVSVDWTLNHKHRKPNQRVSVMMDNISSHVSPAIFLMVKHHSDKDLESIQEVDDTVGNIVSIFER